jgi:hypothetical protein
MTRSLVFEEPRRKTRATRYRNPFVHKVPRYGSGLTIDCPIFSLTGAVLTRTILATHLPRLSPARVTRIKGRFFCCAQCEEGA